MKTLILLLAAFLVPAAAYAAAVDETAPTAAGLAAVEARWQQAFLAGDDAYLEALLTPDYVSVGTNGVPHDREMVLTAARNYALAHPNAVSAPAQDPHMTIRIEGTSGIVTFDVGGQRSVDVFFYSHGRWHAWYSQHTSEGS